MKSLLLLYMLLLPIRQLDVYRVCFISEEGKILRADNKRPVKVTDRLHLNDRLIFRSHSAKMVVINPVKGCLNVTWKGVAGKAGWLAEMRELISPSSEKINFDTRAVGFDGYDPKQYFNAERTGNKMLLIEGKLLLISAEYPVDKSNFFFIEYQDKGEMQTRRIFNDGQGLLFEKKDFPLNGDDIEKHDYIICYQSNSDGQRHSQIIAHIKPVVVQLAEISKQLKLMRSCFKRRTLANRNKLILNFYYQNYGKIGIEALP
jgi:hypothetical protein